MDTSNRVRQVVGVARLHQPRARARYALHRDAVEIAVVSGQHDARIVWSTEVGIATIADPQVATEEPGDWLALDEDVARAIYEALADHFGHSDHDVRALRKDYDAERDRVDRLIGGVLRAAGVDR
ncbi:hypothetical protein GCM10008944_01400 [Cytobacillus oceanisediminis]